MKELTKELSIDLYKIDGLLKHAKYGNEPVDIDAVREIIERCQYQHETRIRHYLEACDSLIAAAEEVADNWCGGDKVENEFKDLEKVLKEVKKLRR